MDKKVLNKLKYGILLIIAFILTLGIFGIIPMSYAFLIVLIVWFMLVSLEVFLQDKREEPKKEYSLSSCKREEPKNDKLLLVLVITSAFVISYMLLLALLLILGPIVNLFPTTGVEGLFIGIVLLVIIFLISANLSVKIVDESIKIVEVFAKKRIMYFILIYFTVIIISAVFFYHIYSDHPDSFLINNTCNVTKELSFFDFVYFSASTMTNLGGGEISPVYWYAKLLAIIEFLVGVLVLLTYLNYIMSKPEKVDKS